MNIVDWSELDAPARTALLARPAQLDPPDVEPIISAIRKGGDAAVREATLRIDKVHVDALRVSDAEIQQAGRKLSNAERLAIDSARDKLMRFHDAGRTRPYSLETAPGVSCRREIRPIEAVGLYVPGGSAPLPSTALMLGVPSALAAVPVRVLCTPPGADGSIHPAILYAAGSCGIREVFRIGGAQAIAAMAYGTESVPKVDKIFGPGNAWVTAAKQQVPTATDMPAGPSELMVVADDSAKPEFIAADLLSQAEHGADSQVFLVTDSREVAEAVAEATQVQLLSLTRREVAAKALASSRIIVVADREAALGVVNSYAPEHLSLALRDADRFLAGVMSAGSVFMGDWTPETLGDYCSGTNHVLPTYGFARTLSGLAVSDFEKRITVQRAERDGLAALGSVAVTLAELEGLDAHANAVRVRLARL